MAAPGHEPHHSCQVRAYHHLETSCALTVKRAYLLLQNVREMQNLSPPSQKHCRYFQAVHVLWMYLTLILRLQLRLHETTLDSQQMWKPSQKYPFACPWTLGGSYLPVLPAHSEGLPLASSVFHRCRG
mmetsp:Transcript_67814/g.148860  ORF Transcript_67814/g.148860 Transcript_67814/m.148860 type:complete len:128 (-) Transcript_67814:2283-2666(-)